MRFETYFLLTSYLFASTGFFAIAMTGRLDAPAILLYVVALVISFRWETKSPKRLIELKYARRLSIAYLGFMVLDAMFLSGWFLVLTHFVLFMSAVKLFQRKEDSDWVWIYALTFFEMTLSAALTINITFIISLVVFLLTFVSTLAAFEIRRSHRSEQRIEEETQAMRRDRPQALGRVRSLVSVAGVQVVIVIAVAVPIFLFMPRFSGGALGSRFGEAQGLTGFSDTVELGDVTNIKQSEQIVMHVSLDRAAGRWLRWRGIALDRFDGRRWTASALDRRSILVDTQSSGRYAVDVPAKREPDLLTQSIIVEGIDSNVMFAARRVVAVEGLLKSLFNDKMGGNLRGPNHGARRLSYIAYSDVSLPTAEELERDVSTDYPTQLATLNLQLPEEVDPRVRELARSVVADARSPYEKARRLESFFKEGFGYSLSPPRKDLSLDPVTDFLLNTRVGHCELFATSMVLMLRAEGVPSRLVNGFQMGEYNDISQTYRIKQKDAHSWVEVYFQGNRAWIEFDPTPSSGLNNYTQAGGYTDFRKTLEALQVFWIRYVVGLDDREQISMLRGLQQYFLDARSWVEDTSEQWKAWGRSQVTAASRSGMLERRRMLAVLGAVMGIGAMAMLLFILHARGWSIGGFVLPVWRWRTPWKRGPQPTDRQAILFYQQMLAILGRYGYERKPFETPREFAERCGLQEVHTLTELYHHSRWGGRTSVATDEVAKALALLGVSLRGEKRSRIAASKRD